MLRDPPFFFSEVLIDWAVTRTAFRSQSSTALGGGQRGSHAQTVVWYRLLKLGQILFEAFSDRGCLQELKVKRFRYQRVRFK